MFSEREDSFANRPPRSPCASGGLAFGVSGSDLTAACDLPKIMPIGFGGALCGELGDGSDRVGIAPSIGHDALRSVGLEKRADRAEICGRVAELFECPKCFRTFKRAWSCMLRSCPFCAKKIFDRAFSELLPLENYIPSSLASMPGWNWKILDFESSG